MNPNLCIVLFESSISTTTYIVSPLYRTCLCWVIPLKVSMDVRPKIHVAFVFDLGKTVTIALQIGWVRGSSNKNQFYIRQ
jgi:hypothetical protein